ncbi:hypothetical protein TWF281_010387 [Arthrobotrys megalospora]
MVSKNYNLSLESEKDEKGRIWTRSAEFPLCDNYAKRLKALEDQFRQEYPARSGIYNSFIFAAVPFRTGDGTLWWGQLPEKDPTYLGCHAVKKMGRGSGHKTLEFWFDFFNKREKATVVTKSTWRARYDTRLLSKPLMILIQPNAIKRFEGSKFGTAEEVFQNLIDAINEKYRKKHSSGDQLQLVSSKKFLDDYLMLSKDPFSLYETYIHQTCIDEYMKDLSYEGSVDPVRSLPQPSNDTFHKAMQRYLDTIENGGNASDDDQEYEEDDEDDVDPLMGTGNADNVGKSIQTNEKVESKLTGDRARPRQGLVKLHFETDLQNSKWITPLEVKISSRRIKNTKGTRRGQKGQKAVMGFSASQMAESVLGWKAYKWPEDAKTPAGNPYRKRMMRNGLYIAEWLHLCAYSWGGIDDEAKSEKDMRGSSQVAENLVVGTSEANSCMTRYESSWQQLFLDESRLRGGEEVRGLLKVYRNSQEDSRWKDNIKRHDGVYTWGEEALWQNLNYGALAKLAAQYKLLAYTISYFPSITTPNGGCTSLLLDRKDTKEHFVFHPFSRRFYHQSEHSLDSALYQAMFILAADKVYKGDSKAVITTRFPTLNKHLLKFYKSVVFEIPPTKQTPDTGFLSSVTRAYSNLSMGSCCGSGTESTDAKTLFVNSDRPAKPGSGVNKLQTANPGQGGLVNQLPHGSLGQGVINQVPSINPQDRFSKDYIYNTWQREQNNYATSQYNQNPVPAPSLFNQQLNIYNTNQQGIGAFRSGSEYPYSSNQNQSGQPSQGRIFNQNDKNLKF